MPLSEDNQVARRRRCVRFVLWLAVVGVLAACANDPVISAGSVGEPAKAVSTTKWTDDDPPPSAQERRFIKQRSELERQRVEANSPAVVHETAQDSNVELPETLDAVELRQLASEAFPDMVLGRIRVEGTYEEAFFTDGSATLMVSWQVWPPQIDHSIAIPEGSEVREVEPGLELISTEADLLAIQTTEARVFDGTRLVSVSLADDKRRDIDLIERLALELADRIARTG